MTEDEAIKWIDDRMCYGRYTPQKHNPFVHDECCQAGEMAIKALEKQIAKKPLLVPVEGTYVHQEYVCPNCREYASDFLKPHHCKCGQKLDWSEV